MPKGFKHTKEAIEKIRKSSIGRRPMLGKKHSDKTKKKMSDAHKKIGTPWLIGKKRKPFTEEHKRRIGMANSIALKGKKHPHTYTKESAEKMRRLKSGKNSNFWKGGISKLSDRIKASYKYRNWRRKVFKRDNWTCQNCSQIGNELHPHHLKQFAMILQQNNIKTVEEAFNCKELWDINNGKTLCRECHKLTKSYASGHIKKI